MVTTDWRGILMEYKVVEQEPNIGYMHMCETCGTGYTATLHTEQAEGALQEPEIYMEWVACGGMCTQPVPIAMGLSSSVGVCAPCFAPLFTVCFPCGFVPACKARYYFKQDRHDPDRFIGTARSLFPGGCLAGLCNELGNEIQIEYKIAGDTSPSTIKLFTPKDSDVNGAAKTHVLDLLPIGPGMGTKLIDAKVAQSFAR